MPSSRYNPERPRWAQIVYGELGNRTRGNLDGASHRHAYPRHAGPESALDDKGSNLREAVVRAFYPNPVQFEPLDWPRRQHDRSASRRGGETAHGRDPLQPQVPASDTRHFVIAHSHGGNIALYALRDPAVRERITGVATLATPFLIARERNLGSIGQVLQLRIRGLGLAGRCGTIRYSVAKRGY